MELEKDIVIPPKDEGTESTRYLGETAFGTVEKVYAVCTVVNDKVTDPKKIEKIYSYIQDMFGPEALDYDTPVSTAALQKTSASMPDADPAEALWDTSSKDS